MSPHAYKRAEERNNSVKLSATETNRRYFRWPRKTILVWVNQSDSRFKSLSGLITHAILRPYAKKNLSSKDAWPTICVNHLSASHLHDVAKLHLMKNKVRHVVSTALPNSMWIAK